MASISRSHSTPNASPQPPLNSRACFAVDKELREVRCHCYDLEISERPIVGQCFVKTTIFISHSTHDKDPVRKLAAELRRRNVSVWLDEWEIPVGGSITDRVQEALRDAKFVAVWLTSHSVVSGWVTKEWQARIFGEISARQISVLPLLAEDCEVPLFLSDKRYADFRSSFRHGFADLMRTLSGQNVHEPLIPASDRFFTVLDQTKGFLKDLEEAQIPLPTVGNLKIVKSLKSLPRSGKLLRLEGMVPTLPIRSIYDHTLSVAHSADCLLPLIDSNLYENERVELSRVTAYHDVCEVILGDIPQYTRLNRSKRNRARIAAEIRLSQMKEGEPERVTNEFIAMFLQDSERYSLKRTVQVMAGRSAVRQFFYSMDKLDPIIAVWRYIHCFRNDSSFRIDEFLNRMRHFFENPRVRTALKETDSDPRLLQLAEHLQNPAKAREYYRDALLLQENLFVFPEGVVRNLVEGRTLEYVTPNTHRRLPK